MMDRSQFVSLSVATLCLTAIGVSATTLGETVSTKPDDVIDLDFEDLPIGQDSAEDIDREIESNKGGDDAADGQTGESDDSRSSTGDPGGDGSAATDGSGVRSKAADDGQQASGGETGPEESGASEQSGGSSSGNNDGDGESALGQQASSGDGNDGMGPGGQRSLLERLLALLAKLLPYLLGLAVLASVAGVLYRYRDRLLALAMVPFGDRGGSATTDEPPSHPWRDVTITDDVQRAWYAMVDHVDVERPWAKTPDECRRAAVESGLDPDAVGTLTETFRQARYADQEPSSEHKRRARESLDRLDLGRGSI